MGDLAAGIVDLARFSERRRESRRQFHDAVAVIGENLLKHLRVGDRAEVRGSGYPGATYRVERITWSVRNPFGKFDDPEARDGLPYEATRLHPVGDSSLVRYEGTDDLDEPGCVYAGAVVVDVRSSWNDVVRGEWKVAGRHVERRPRPEDANHCTYNLRLASDEDLLSFASEVEELVNALASGIQADAERMSSATSAIARFAPR